MMLPPVDFESTASAIPPLRQIKHSYSIIKIIYMQAKLKIILKIYLLNFVILIKNNKFRRFACVIINIFVKYFTKIQNFCQSTLTFEKIDDYNHT